MQRYLSEVKLDKPLFCFNWVDSSFKDRVHCFSMQVVMNKCFFLNPEKKFDANVVFEINAPLIPKNDGC